MQQVVAEPVVASQVVESDFILRPRTVEEAGTVNILLDQQRNAAGCKNSSTNNIATSLNSCCNLFYDIFHVWIFRERKKSYKKLISSSADEIVNVNFFNDHLVTRTTKYNKLSHKF